MTPENKLSDEPRSPSNREIIQRTWAGLARKIVDQAVANGTRITHLPDILHLSRPRGDCSEALKEQGLAEEGQPPRLIDLREDQT